VADVGESYPHYIAPVEHALQDTTVVEVVPDVVVTEAE
jgi:hypothetical protein